MKKVLAANLPFDPITTPSGYEPTGSGIAGYSSQLEKVISNVLVVLTIVAGISFILYFLIGGLTWITAGGQKDKIEAAKSYMTGGAIGLIIVTVSYAIVWIVGEALGLNILVPSELLNNLTFN